MYNLLRYPYQDGDKEVQIFQSALARFAEQGKPIRVGIIGAGKFGAGLVAVTAPMSIIKAAIYGQPTGAPLSRPTAEVMTVAKRDLKRGEILDGSGGYTVNGLCEKAAVARAENLLPLGLSTGAKLEQGVAQGAAITYDLVELDDDSFVLQLRRL